VEMAAAVKKEESSQTKKKEEFKRKRCLVYYCLKWILLCTGVSIQTKTSFRIFIIGVRIIFRFIKIFRVLCN
jgi:hypothetical protein